MGRYNEGPETESLRVQVARTLRGRASHFAPKLGRTPGRLRDEWEGKAYLGHVHVQAFLSVVTEQRRLAETLVKRPPQLLPDLVAASGELLVWRARETELIHNITKGRDVEDSAIEVYLDTKAKADAIDESIVLTLQVLAGQCLASEVAR